MSVISIEELLGIIRTIKENGRFGVILIVAKVVASGISLRMSFFPATQLVSQTLIRKPRKYKLKIWTQSVFQGNKGKKKHFLLKK